MLPISYLPYAMSPLPSPEMPFGFPLPIGLRPSEYNNWESFDLGPRAQSSQPIYGERELINRVGFQPQAMRTDRYLTENLPYHRSSSRSQEYSSSEYQGPSTTQLSKQETFKASPQQSHPRQTPFKNPALQLLRN